MARNPSPENIWEIKYLLNQGNTISAIAQQVHCTRNCVRKWKNRLAIEADGGPLAQDLRKTRQPAYKLLDEDLTAVKNYLLQNPFASVRRLPGILNLPLHEKTLRRGLKKRTNLRFRRPAKKAALRPLDTEERLQYARNNVKNPVSMWKRVIALDEKKFSTEADGKFRKVSFDSYKQRKLSFR